MALATHIDMNGNLQVEIEGAPVACVDLEACMYRDEDELNWRKVEAALAADLRIHGKLAWLSTAVRSAHETTGC